MIILRISVVAILGAFFWVPFLNLESAPSILQYHVWTFYGTILAFALLIYPAFIVWPAVVDIRYDTVCCIIFTCMMSMQFSATVFYFSAVYDYYMLNSGNIFQQILYSLTPIVLNVLPCAFYIVEFFMDMIFFAKEQWYLCFVPAGVSALYVIIDYIRVVFIPG